MMKRNQAHRFNPIYILNGLILLFGHVAEAQDTSDKTPLYQKRFPWPNLPYKADTGNGERGPQSGE